jgi:dihydroorotase
VAAFTQTGKSTSIKGEIGILYIVNGRVIDPSSGMDKPCDIFIEDGVIKELGSFKNNLAPGAEVIDAKGYWVVPGLIDLHVHLREPGLSYKETIESGTRAAAAGGFTTVCCMPNTSPYADTPETVEWILRRAKERANGVKVLPVGGLTHMQRGVRLARLREMAEAGAAAFSEDGKSVADEALAREAFKIAAGLNKPVFSHCEDEKLVNGGVVHMGAASVKYGVPGIPSESEWKYVQRDIRLASETGARLHICHVSAKESVALVRRARNGGLPVTAEVCPHHFAFCDEDINADDGRFKMNPPLRTRADRDALLEGLADGTLHVIATDHAPHSKDEKAKGLLGSAFGVIGLETAAAAGITFLVEKKILTPMQLIKAMTASPAGVLRTEGGSLRVGRAADVTVIDPAADCVTDRFFSKGSGTPFYGMQLHGKIMYTVTQGIICFRGGGKYGD